MDGVKTHATHALLCASATQPKVGSLHWSIWPWKQNLPLQNLLLQNLWNLCQDILKFQCVLCNVQTFWMVCLHWKLFWCFKTSTVKAAHCSLNMVAQWTAKGSWEKALAECKCHKVNAPDLGQGSSSVCIWGGIVETSSMLKTLFSLVAVYPSAILSSLS